MLFWGEYGIFEVEGSKKKEKGQLVAPGSLSGRKQTHQKQFSQEK